MSGQIGDERGNTPRLPTRSLGGIGTKAALAFHCLAALIILLCQTSCSPFLPVSEDEYVEKKLGTPEYFRDSFEKNNGITSTIHFFTRTANTAGEKPAVSRDWASEGAWSMKIPAGATLSFKIAPNETGTMAISLSGMGAGYLLSNIAADGVFRITDVDPDPAIVKTRFTLYAGREYSIAFPTTDNVLYIDDIEFTPLLYGAAPGNGGITYPAPTLDWGDIPGGSPYRLQVSYYENFSTTVVDVSHIPSSDYRLSGLAAGKCYFWRILASPGSTTESWSSPSRFYVAASPSDESFETDLYGANALNAWYGKSLITPMIVSTDAKSGSHALRLAQEDIQGRECWAEMAVRLSSPKVLHYSYKIIGQGEMDSPALYLKYTSVVEAGASFTPLASNVVTTTEGNWVKAAEILPAGEDLLRWSFVRTADDSCPGAYALIDDIRFSDPPSFVGEDFEATNVAGDSAIEWGYSGWKPPVLQSSGGVGDSRCALLPKHIGASYSLQHNSSQLRTFAETSKEAFICAVRTKGEAGEAGVSLGPPGGGGQIGYIADVYDYDKAGWREQFTWMRAENSSGVFTLDITNGTGASILVDDIRVIDIRPLDPSGISEGFEAGELEDAYFYDKTCPPIVESVSAHSGSYCLGLKKYAGPRRTFFAFPISIDRPSTLSFWIKAEGSPYGSDFLDVGNFYSSISLRNIGSTWERKTMSLQPGDMASWPLVFLFTYAVTGDYTIYIDDIMLTPD